MCVVVTIWHRPGEDVAKRAARIVVELLLAWHLHKVLVRSLHRCAGTVGVEEAGLIQRHGGVLGVEDVVAAVGGLAELLACRQRGRGGVVQRLPVAGQALTVDVLPSNVPPDLLAAVGEPNGQAGVEAQRTLISQVDPAIRGPPAVGLRAPGLCQTALLQLLAVFMKQRLHVRLFLKYHLYDTGRARFTFSHDLVKVHGPPLRQQGVGLGVAGADTLQHQARLHMVATAHGISGSGYGHHHGAVLHDVLHVLGGDSVGKDVLRLQNVEEDGQLLARQRHHGLHVAPQLGAAKGRGLPEVIAVVVVGIAIGGQRIGRQQRALDTGDFSQERGVVHLPRAAFDFEHARWRQAY
mmetsp:Transcript_10689/g.25212  ORF Transcript_10689/g.25212 Transcript_10689/m.25212 type:complete len:351 (-) Transcript_10689:1140-2192(-)